MIKKLKKRKYFSLFLMLFLIGTIISIFYYNSLSKEDVLVITSNIKDDSIIKYINNNTIDHLKILSIITLFSLIFIGTPVLFGLIISEGFNLSFRIIFLLKIYKFNGLLYGLIYYLINNGIYLYLLYILYKRVIKVFKKLYSYKFKNETINYYEINSFILRNIGIIIIIFISDFIIYKYGYNLLKLFAFLIK